MNARKQNLAKWIGELELSLAVAQDCGDDTSELELSLANAREELEGLK